MSVVLLVDGAPAIETTLAAFLADNEFEPEDRAAIEADMAGGGVHLGGGGAQPEFVLMTSAYYAEVTRAIPA